MLGVAGGVTAISDLFVLVAVWMHDEFDLSISYFFIGMAICAMVVAAVMWMVSGLRFGCVRACVC